MAYLAELFTAGDTGVVEGVLRRLAAMRSYMRDISLGRETQPHIPASVGMTEEEMYSMYRLLAIAKYEERYVIPTAYSQKAHELEHMGCSITGGPNGHEEDPFVGADEQSGSSFHMVENGGHAQRPRGRTNLLNWGGGDQAVPEMFPEHQ
jgi:nitrate reductase beta subunit